LIARSQRQFSNCPEATAAFVATGEQRTAALLAGVLGRSGIPARMVKPREIALIAEGSHLESAPVHVDATAIEDLWRTHAAVLVLPGFYGVSAQGHTALFGRGGSLRFPHFSACNSVRSGRSNGTDFHPHNVDI
jgi:aspartate kinase